jgi:hypothetical protein
MPILIGSGWGGQGKQEGSARGKIAPVIYSMPSALLAAVNGRTDLAGVPTLRQEEEGCGIAAKNAGDEKGQAIQ